MRQYLAKKRTYTVEDLRRLATDYRHNAFRTETPEAFERNYNEYKAINYVLFIAERGRAPYRGRPSKRAKFYLDRTSRLNYSGKI
jgi:hypothetical protein